MSTKQTIIPTLEYPATRTENLIESVAGIEFKDPYRWLEANTDEVRQWQTEQGQLATEYTRAWPHFETLKQSVAYFLVDKVNTVPRFAGGKWFRIDRPKGASQTRILISDTPYGIGRVVFDPGDENPDSPPFLSWLSPSPDGQVLAFGVCSDGSEHNTIRLVDVDTAKLLPKAPPQTLMDAWTGGACWLPNSSGFYFLALTGDKQDFRQRLLFHKLIDNTQSPVDVPLPYPDSQEYLMVTLSPQGRYLVVSHSLANPHPIVFRDLNQANASWQPFITEAKGTIAGYVMEEQYIAVTDIQAPRGRIVAIPLHSATPNDPSSWTELVPESAGIIRSITPVGEWLYVHEFIDTYSRLRIVDLNGVPVGEVPLPGKGAIAEQYLPLMNIVTQGHPDEYLFGFSSLTESWGVYRHRPGQAEIEILSPPQVKIENALVEDYWATSADGTRIPYHCVRLANTVSSKPQPTLLYAYGGFNVPWIPEFPGAMAAFVAADGIFVHAHLRGGGEFGLQWWQGGRLKNKRNCYQDLYAIAEDLVEKGRTTSQRLAVTGESNGGLMAGVALTQRPDLWRAVVPKVPILDLMGGLRDPYSRAGIKIEFGDPDDPDEIRRIADFSPYHLVKKTTGYPAVYIAAGDTDPRCPPWHARKFAARLQAANTTDSPVLVHIWENVGHGLATAMDIQILESTEWLAFVMHQLEMTPS